MEKRFSLLRIFVNYGCKKFYNFEPRAHSGTELDGIPVYCGGIIDEEDQVSIF
jgi:hypothetical protein